MNIWRSFIRETPGIGIAGEPLALGPAFRWEGSDRLALPPAPRLGADTDELVTKTGANC